MVFARYIICAVASTVALATDQCPRPTTNKLVVVRRAGRVLPVSAEMLDTVARHQRGYYNPAADGAATSCSFR